jgi:hypothetical protein
MEKCSICSHIRIYINEVANSVMLYVQHEFYNLIFKIKHKLHIPQGRPLPPTKEKFWVHTSDGCPLILLYFVTQQELHTESLSIKHKMKPRCL